MKLMSWPAGRPFAWTIVPEAVQPAAVGAPPPPCLPPANAVTGRARTITRAAATPNLCSCIPLLLSGDATSDRRHEGAARHSHEGATGGGRSAAPGSVA